MLLSWCAEHTARLQLHYLLLGFHSTLYGPAEYLYVFWYLDHVLEVGLQYTEARERACWGGRGAEVGEGWGEREKAGAGGTRQNI